MDCSSLDRIQASPTGVLTGVIESLSASNLATPELSAIPAHSANVSPLAGPKMCRYRRASSRRASSGSTSGGGPVRMVGFPEPSHRIRPFR